jgi:hypothetical protein
MNRCLGWAALVIASIFLGIASGSYQKTSAESDPPPASAGNSEADTGEIIAQLKEINSQLKEINKHLHSGVTKVTIPMNPDKSN